MTIVCDDCLNYLPTILPKETNVILTDPDWSMTKFDWKRFFKICRDVTCNGTTVVVWGASPDALGRLLSLLHLIQYHVKHIFVWHKPNGSGPTGWGISRRWEAVVWIDGRPKRRGELRFLPDVWTIPRITSIMREDMGHCWQKPLDLCQMMVLGFSNPGDTVIDPFCGSGPILVEAMFRDREVLGCDIDCRWANVTRAAVLGKPNSRRGDLF